MSTNPLAPILNRLARSSAGALAKLGVSITPDDARKLCERPRNPDFGDVALPLFVWSKLARQSPAQVFVALKSELEMTGDWGDMALVGAYMNLTYATPALARGVIGEALRSSENGVSSEGQGKTILVEYSAPNIAKPFGIGHLRSTVIGDALANVYAQRGYAVTRINYLGDWGTQFGKMIVGVRRFGHTVPALVAAIEQGGGTTTDEVVREAYQLYVTFHEKEDADPNLTEEARQAFKALEQGGVEETRLWNAFKNISLREFERVYDLLGIRFDLVTGESFLNDKMDSAIARLNKAGLTTESRGALVVDLESSNLPACLLRKQDGATLYATRDIAGLIWRWETYHFHESLYVVGAAQADHFKQVFAVLDRLETAEGLPQEKRMTGRVSHVPFGWVKFEDKALSTRRGNLIFLEDVLNQAIALAKEKIAEKNSDLANADTVARHIGVGAIKFMQLSVRKQKDVNFSWERALSFEGETGPYLQYTHARVCSLIRKHNQPLPSIESIDWTGYDSPEARRLLLAIARFEDTLAMVLAEYEPSILSAFLLDLASQFNSYYQRKDASGRLVKILSEDKSATDAAILLVEATRRTVHSGLTLLGIVAPEEM